MFSLTETATQATSANAANKHIINILIFA